MIEKEKQTINTNCKKVKLWTDRFKPHVSFLKIINNGK